jgi:hypothetical protein
VPFNLKGEFDFSPLKVSEYRLSSSKTKPPNLPDLASTVPLKLPVAAFNSPENSPLVAKTVPLK